LLKKSPHRLRVGDLAKIVRIPADLKDSAYIGTPAVFKRALGKTFRIEASGREGHIELEVSERDTIWIEPDFVVRAPKCCLKK